MTNTACKLPGSHVATHLRQLRVRKADFNHAHERQARAAGSCLTLAINAGADVPARWGCDYRTGLGMWPDRSD